MTPPPGDPPRLSPAAASQLGDLLAGLDRLDPILGLPAFPQVAAPPHRFGRYELCARLGAGAHGVVLLARAPALDRRVVVKVPQPAVLTDPELCERFVREARAAAALEHPGIVSVLDAGRIDGLPYLVAAYVPGPTLAGWRDRHPAPVPPRAAAGLVAALAAAAQHAHERGVLHCDLTPSNVLLSPAGAAPPAELGAYAPMVSDFGLARLTEEDPGLTATFRVAGTPAYMAPEQARGERRDLTARTDVYALGAILYELLTGGTPFPPGPGAEILPRVIRDLPPRPRSVSPDVPRDLEAVCLKCLEKNPGERYASAAALAADLNRFLAGRPTRARPAGPAATAARWARRRPGLAAAVVAAALAWAAIPALVVGYTDRLAAETAARAAAERKEREHAFYAGLERVRQRRAEPLPGWADENLADLRALAAAAPDPAPLPDLRSEAAAALGAVDLRPVRALGEGFGAYAPAFAPDGRAVALGGWEWDAGARAGRVLLADPATGRAVRELAFPVDPAWAARAGAPDGCRCVRFSPDGRWLVAGTRGGQLARWDLAAPGAPPVVWAAHAGDAPERRVWVMCLAFAADGGTLYSSCPEATRAWDVRGGWRPRGGPRAFVVPSATPVVGDTFPVVRVDPAGGWELCGFDPRADRFAPSGVIAGDVFGATADGRLAGALAIPGDRLHLAAPEPGAQPLALAAAGAPPAARAAPKQIGFDPAGALLVTSEEHARRLKVWDAAAGRLVADRPFGGGSGRFAFSPDGRHLAVCEERGTVLYEVTGRPLEALAVGPRWWAGPVAASPDGRELAALHGDPRGAAELSTWSAPPGRAAARTGGRRLDVFAGVPPSAARAADGRFAFATLRAGPTRAEPGGRIETGAGAAVECAEVADLRFGPDGRLWAAAADRVQALTVPGLSAATVLENAPAARGAGMVFRAVAPGRGVTAVGRRDGDVFLLRPGGPPGPPVRALGSGVTALALTPDEARVLVGGERGELVVLGTGGGPPRPVPGAHRDAVTAIATGPGGWVATGSADRTVRLWDARLDPVLTLRFGGPVQQLFVSTDGQLLTVLVGGERGVRRWRLDLLAAALADLGIEPGWPR